MDICDGNWELRKSKFIKDCRVADNDYVLISYIKIYHLHSVHYARNKAEADFITTLFCTTQVHDFIMLFYFNIASTNIFLSLMTQFS